MAGAAPQHHFERLEALAATLLVDADLSSLLQHIVKITSELLPAPGGASVSLWDETSKTFQFGATSVPGQTPEAAQLVRKRGATHWIMTNLQPRVVPDTARDEFGDSPLLREFGLKAYLGVPLQMNGKAFGVLYAFDTEVRTYKDDDIYFLTLLAARAANAIHHVRLLEESQRTLRRTKALLQVSSALITSAEEDAALQTVVDSMTEGLQAAHVGLLIIDEQKRLITSQFHSHQRDAIPLDFEEAWEGLTGWVMREKRTAVSPKNRPDPRESVRVQARRRNGGVGTIIVAPLLFKDNLYGTVTAWRKLNDHDFNEDDVRLVEALAGQAAVTLRNKYLLAETKQLATIDALTGCLNRRAFFELAEHELKRHQRLQKPFSVVMFDLDHFKSINDQHGHAVGDEVLTAVSARVKQACRNVDIFGRFGGEEFVLLLPETLLDDALEIAERLRQATQQPLHTKAGELHVTMSLGVTQAEALDETIDAVLERADTGLYKAKRAGRNRVLTVSAPSVE
jgi:diguanylate cyclase (GGDEF)-like protein